MKAYNKQSTLQGGEGNILLVGSPVVGLSSVPLLHPITPLIGRYGFNVGQRGAEPPSADTCTCATREPGTGWGKQLGKGGGGGGKAFASRTIKPKAAEEVEVVEGDDEEATATSRDATEPEQTALYMVQPPRG